MNVEYIDVAGLSIQEAETLIQDTREKYRSRNDIISQHMQQEQSRRASELNHQDHPTRLMYVKDQQVQVDVDMVPVVKWLNALPNTHTAYCCQGDTDTDNDGKHKKPYIIWRCKDEASLTYVIKKFADFHEHSATQNVRHTYHEITTEIDYFDGNLRYHTRWYDNLSLNDFIQWARL